MWLAFLYERIYRHGDNVVLDHPNGNFVLRLRGQPAGFPLVSRLNGGVIIF